MIKINREKMQSLLLLLLNRRKYNLVEGYPDIYITRGSEKIGATWNKETVWDKELINKFFSLLNKKDEFFTVLDIGAQTGCFTLLAKYFPNSQWYAFEPIKEAAKALNENLKLNKIKNVTIVEAGVSDQSGSGYLKIPSDHHWGLSTLADDVTRFSEFENRKVELVSLDDYFNKEDMKKIDFIKIDTEGWEFFVLKGAKALIKKNRSIILMEYNEENLKQSHVKKDEIDEFFIEMQYHYEFVGHDDILCIPK